MPPTSTPAQLPRALLRTLAPPRPAISRAAAAAIPARNNARYSSASRHFSASAAARTAAEKKKPKDDATAAAPPPPAADQSRTDTAYLGTKKRLPEFSLRDKVILVSGGARGLGLTQAEALLEAGATGL